MVVFIFALMLALVSQTPTKAQVTLDVSKITCWQSATYNVTNPDFIASWVSGYDRGKRGDTVIDTQQPIANGSGNCARAATRSNSRLWTGRAACQATSASV
jgi:hypothetical protein